MSDTWISYVMGCAKTLSITPMGKVWAEVILARSPIFVSDELAIAA